VCRPVVAAFVLLFAMLIGCGRQEAPIDAMTLFSLDGNYTPEDGKQPPSEMFNGYPVLGKLEIASPNDRLAILRAVQRGIAESDGKEAKCFWPRHGVRLKQSGKTIEFLICFHCLQLEQYIDGKPVHKPTTDTPKSVLNGYLKQARVPQQQSAD
jgi:hypothetical protein